MLRDLFVRGKYRDVILPMCVLRRLDAVLEPTKQAVLDTKKMLDDAGITEQRAAQYTRRLRRGPCGGLIGAPSGIEPRSLPPGGVEAHEDQRQAPPGLRTRVDHDAAAARVAGPAGVGADELSVHVQVPVVVAVVQERVGARIVRADRARVDGGKSRQSVPSLGDPSYHQEKSTWETTSA